MDLNLYKKLLGVNVNEPQLMKEGPSWKSAIETSLPSRCLGDRTVTSAPKTPKKPPLRRRRTSYERWIGWMVNISEYPSPRPRAPEMQKPTFQRSSYFTTSRKRGRYKKEKSTSPLLLSPLSFRWRRPDNGIDFNCFMCPSASLHCPVQELCFIILNNRLCQFVSSFAGNNCGVKRPRKRAFNYTVPVSGRSMI